MFRYPALALVTGKATWGAWALFWSLLITLGVVRLALILTCFTSAFVILNNAVPIQSRGVCVCVCVCVCVRVCVR